VLVMDPLHTHTPAARDEALAPAAARRLRVRRDIHETPTPGRWVKRAEPDLSVLATPGVDRRMPDSTPLLPDGAAWARRRHAAKGRVEWRFTTHEASITLTHLYPSIPRG
jgi:hypothetical protein